MAAPLNICWPEPQFPHKVSAAGGIYVFKDSREVPDTFHLMADYKKGHSVVLTSSMANSQHIPGLIRGHLGTIIMVDNGQFESTTDHITLKPERRVIDEAYVAKFGKEDTCDAGHSRRTRRLRTPRTSSNACAPARSPGWTLRPPPAPRC